MGLPRLWKGINQEILTQTPSADKSAPTALLIQLNQRHSQVQIKQPL